jgi:replicative DNA helicase
MPEIYPNHSTRTSGDEAHTSDFRQPPHNIDAEQALLGAILVNNEAMEHVNELLEPAHFFEPLHEKIFEVAGKLIQTGKQATPITLRTFFENAEPIAPDLTVPQYLGRLAANATTIINARAYGRTIFDLATRRGLIVIGEEMVRVAYDSPVDATPLHQIEVTEKSLYALAERGTAGGGMAPPSVVAERALQRANDAYQRGDKMRGLSTGLVELDRMTRGLAPSSLIIVAGRPGMGKTALAGGIAYRLARQGTPVGFFSLEMPADEIMDREASARSKIPFERIQSGEFHSEAEWRSYQGAITEIGKWPCYVDETGGLNVAQLVTRARRMKRRHGVELVVIDYLQLMKGTRDRDNRVQEVTEITTGLKALAKELKVPVVALSQLSRKVEDRDHKRPQLADLRDSGSIEQDADVVMFAFREEYYEEQKRPSVDQVEAFRAWQQKLKACAGKAEIIIAKNRHGPAAVVPVAFHSRLTRFSNLARSSEVAHGS